MSNQDQEEDMNDISKKLQEPFHEDDLEWRVQRCGVSGAKNAWVAVVAYVTNRAIQQRLDDVLGLGKWQNEYIPSPDGKGFLCGISIKIGDQWVTKWDGAENTNIEPLKGGLSGSMKRAAVQLGIGRYLYNLETKFAICTLIDHRRESDNNYAKCKVGDIEYHIDWRNPELPEWALPNVESDMFIKNIKESLNMIELKEAFKESYLHAKSFGREDLKDKFQEAYEDRKTEIDLIAQTNVEKALTEITSWLKKQIDTLTMIPNESSVSRVCKTLIEHVERNSEGQYYDKAPLIQSINDAEKERIETIKNQNSEENNDD